jgi:hypothetical protein
MTPHHITPHITSHHTSHHTTPHHTHQVLGGNGYTAEHQVERLWRDAKLVEIGGGTNEAHHKNIVRDIKKANFKIG